MLTTLPSLVTLPLRIDLPTPLDHAKRINCQIPNQKRRHTTPVFGGRLHAIQSRVRKALEIPPIRSPQTPLQLDTVSSQTIRFLPTTNLLFYAVYYQLYQDQTQIRIPSKSCFSSQNIFIGRIDLLEISPPRRVIGIIKRHIAALESIGSRDVLAIYFQSDRYVPASNGTKVAQNLGEPGLSAEDPLSVSIFTPGYIPPDLPSPVPPTPLEKQQAQAPKAFRSPADRDKVLTDIKPLHWKTAMVRDSCKF